MDFSTIRKKIQNLEYEYHEKIIEDIRLVFENCHAYNEPGSEIYKTGERISNIFEKLLKKQLI